MSTTLNLTGEVAEDGFAPGAQMSFLSHLDELRHRVVRSVVFVFVALCGCWFVSDHIYNFLAMPIQTALSPKRSAGNYSRERPCAAWVRQF